MRSPIEGYLRELHADLSRLRGGVPYQGIPAMAGVNPDEFAIALATVDGHVYQVGDTQSEFSIQSISKPFSYGLALDDLGAGPVDEKIDVEPSGDAFNEISLARDTGRPANAMINAGAIAAVSLIPEAPGATRFERILERFSLCAGRQLAVSEEIYHSEAQTGHRNRALAYLLRSFGIIETDPTRALEDYFRACSVMVTTPDLAMMAATLANAGSHPVTGVQAMGLDAVQRVLSVMTTCGMYDDAGAWMSTVGLPAKSGVGGGLIAVLPGQLGLAVYSPPLDAHGSSVRGVAACERMSRDMGLHFVRAARIGRSTVRGSYDVRAVPSAVRHSQAEEELLDAQGYRARIVELTGDLLFAGTESMVRAITELDPEVELVLLDVRRVDETDAVALAMMCELRDQLAEEGRVLGLIDEAGATSSHVCAEGDPLFTTRTEAVEWAEEQLLARYGGEHLSATEVDIPDFDVLAPLSTADIAVLEELMVPLQVQDGIFLRKTGENFGGVYFILSGKVTTSTSEGGHLVRHAMLGPGMTFGEIALGSGGDQVTQVTARGPVRLKLLGAQAIEQLEEQRPELALRLWKAVARDAYTLVEQNLREAAVRIGD
ncbi:glutaminase A [Paeniglutamicibacter cryotolerans]|uniref:Glutaminase n=1 Tax=Paeniglutamicibacter cryotolerans TaxID=670079 RepID=A0A839QLA0_9MICC|nr:glutaminase A [Paeniglutamicibacter cryotolerans]MBB2995544.1 glutaminase [Paeniglutamicibacter cryotolerans]